MRKIKTSELTGAALDWAVANLEWEPQRLFLYGEPKQHIRVANQVDLEHCYRYSIAYSPSTSWAQGGPIIERKCIELSLTPCGYSGVTPGTWIAYKGVPDDDMIEGSGQTPLIAAMRCFVASKLGDEVEVSDELV